MLEQSQLHWSQLDLHRAARNTPSETIETQRAKRDLFTHSRAGTAAQQTSNARAKLLIRDRLHDVAISACIKSANYCCGIFGSRVKQDGCCLARGTKLLENLESVAVAQLQVENDSIVLIDER
jgi:hypothetical protein